MTKHTVLVIPLFLVPLSLYSFIKFYGLKLHTRRRRVHLTVSTPVPSSLVRGRLGIQLSHYLRRVKEKTPCSETKTTTVGNPSYTNNF